MNYVIIENQVTFDSVANLRVIAESRSDPGLYELVAKGFDILNMSESAAAQRRRRDHYANYGNNMLDTTKEIK